MGGDDAAGAGRHLNDQLELRLRERGLSPATRSPSVVGVDLDEVRAATDLVDWQRTRGQLHRQEPPGAGGGTLTILVAGFARIQRSAASLNFCKFSYLPTKSLFEILAQ